MAYHSLWKLVFWVICNEDGEEVLKGKKKRKKKERKQMIGPHPDNFVQVIEKRLMLTHETYITGK